MKAASLKLVPLLRGATSKKLLKKPTLDDLFNTTQSAHSTLAQAPQPINPYQQAT